jgi:hypothetical protein
MGKKSEKIVERNEYGIKNDIVGAIEKSARERRIASEMG